MKQQALALAACACAVRTCAFQVVPTARARHHTASPLLQPAASHIERYSGSRYLAPPCKPLRVVMLDIQKEALAELDEDEEHMSIVKLSELTHSGEAVDAVAPAKDEDGNYWAYRGLLALVAVLWGTNFGTVKFVQNADISASVAALSRFGIAAVAMSPFLFKGDKAVFKAGFECGLWIALGYITQAIGLQSTDANKSAFICSLTVVIVPLINWLRGKGIQWNNGIAALLALLGTGVLELGDSSVPTMGDLWSLGQAFGFGIAFTRIEHYMEKFPGQALSLAASQLLAVATVSLGWAVVDSGGVLPDLSFFGTPSIALALGYTGLITTALAVYLETIALQRVSAAEMSVIFATEPLWATGFASVLLGETLGPQAAIGAVFILAACLTAQGPKVLELIQARKLKGE